MAGPRGWLVLLLSFLFTFFLCILGKSTTSNIDDKDSGTLTPKPGHGIAFLPAKNGHWNDEAACNPSSRFCLPAEPSKAFGQSWTSTALYRTSEARRVIVEFFGDGIKIFFTLVATGPANYSTICSFDLDSKEIRQYKHIPVEDDEVTFTYQVNTFSQIGLEHGRHRLIISVPPSTQESSYLNFDYAQYSFDDKYTGQGGMRMKNSKSSSKDDTQTKSSNEGVSKAAIIGGSVSGVVVFLAIVVLLVYLARRRRRQLRDKFTLGVPSSYAGSTRKLSLPFWPHKPASAGSESNNPALTPLPHNGRSVSPYFPDPYQEKYDQDYPYSPATSTTHLRNQEPQAVRTRDRASIMSPTKALIESFYPARSRRESTTTGKLSRLEDSFSPSSNFPRHLSRFSDNSSVARANHAVQQTSSPSSTFLTP